MGKTRRNHPKYDEQGAQPMSAGEHVYHARRCYGKKSYPTHAKAVRAKRACNREFGKRYRVYCCPYCNKWHLTTHRW